MRAPGDYGGGWGSGVGVPTYIRRAGLTRLIERIVATLLLQQPPEPRGAIVEVLLEELHWRRSSAAAPSGGATGATPQQALPLAPADLTPDARDYCQRHRLAFIIEDWLQALAAEEPHDAVEWSLAFFAHMQQYDVAAATSGREESPLPASPAPPANEGAPHWRDPTSKGPEGERVRSIAQHPVRFVRKQRPRILILFYSTYRHGEALALAAAAGARTVTADVHVKRVRETLDPSILEKMQAATPNSAIPLANPMELQDFDGIIFCFPTRFGAAPAQVQVFMDATGPLWASGALVGKAAAVMVTTAAQHGGQETTIVGFHQQLLHHGMVIVGLPHRELASEDDGEVRGGSPYGASAAVGLSGERAVSQAEATLAQVLGARVAEMASKLASTPAPA